MGKLYNFISGTNNRNDKGISKKQVEYDKKLGFGFFFKLLKMKLGKFSGSNLIFALCNIFFFVALLGLTGTFNDETVAAANPLYAQVSAVAKNESGPGIATLVSVYCSSVYTPVLSDISIGLMCSGLVLIFTFGVSTIGLVYNMRNICTGEHIDTWHDFFYAIKSNFKQGIVIGILDICLLFLLIYDIIMYSSVANSGMMYLIFFYTSILLTVLYYIMRFYMYLQLVTCKMSTFKIIKNSFLLVSLGIKRNLAALIGTIVFLLIYIYIYILLPQVAIIMFCMFTFAFLTYIGVYCAYPVVKKYVIDPYYDEHPEERPEDPYELDEQVFADREI